MAEAEHPTKQPNIVFITTDQQRYDSLRCTGNPYAVTPNLEALAGDPQTTIFDRCITASSICQPSRASMLTGTYASYHGLWTNGVALPRAEDVPLPDGLRKMAESVFPGKWITTGIPTFADCLADAGYHTASVGKMHFQPTGADRSLGHYENGGRWFEDKTLRDWHGPYYGFQDVWCTIGHGELRAGHYGFWLRDHFPEVDRAITSERQTRTLEFPEEREIYPSPVPVEAHNSTWIGDNAARIIREHTATQPLCLWVGFPDPHHPFVPPRELASEFEKHKTLESKLPYNVERDADKPEALHNLMRKRDAASRSPEVIRRLQQYTDALNHLLDQNVGKIINALKATGQWDNTLLVFTSDHGDFLGDFGMHGKCLTPGKSLNHVPLIVRNPFAEDWPRRCSKTVSNVDFLPTFLELSGARLPDSDDRLHGESLNAVVRDGRQHPVLIQHFTPNPRRRNLSVYDDRFRYTVYPETAEEELYDHFDDEYETKNRAAMTSLKGDRDRLRQMLLERNFEVTLPRSGRVTIW
ncbi:MAG: sulfatase [Opitutales bacterium]